MPSLLSTSVFVLKLAKRFVLKEKSMLNEGIGKVKKWTDEFKTFAIKGNVIDMAVGIIIGAAFGK